MIVLDGVLHEIYAEAAVQASREWWARGLPFPDPSPLQILCGEARRQLLVNAPDEMTAMLNATARRDAIDNAEEEDL